MKDIQFTAGDQRFNCRVNGACVKNNRILLSKLKEDENWTLVGGKVAFGEATDTAILREYREETGACLQIERLLAVTENFFDLQGYRWHQYIFFYQLRDDGDTLAFFEGERQVADNEDAVYRWFDLAELESVPLKPDCVREVLKNLSGGVRHYIDREN